MKYQPKTDMPLLDCLAILYPDSPRKRLKQLVAEKRVWVYGELAKIPGMIVKCGTPVEIRRERFVSRNLPNVGIIYEDEHLLVADKKEQFLSVATDREKEKTAFHQILHYLGQKDTNARLFVVHRLDFGTSGLMLFAKSEEIREKLKDLFAHHTIQRHYRALVEGHMHPEEGSLQNRLAESQTLRVYVSKNPKIGKHAITHYKVWKKGKTRSLLDVRLETGRRGQIRVQLANAGHPVVGDREHGAGEDAGSCLVGRLCLHAHRLEFKHPVTGKLMMMESKMPASFLSFLNHPEIRERERSLRA